MTRWRKGDRTVRLLSLYYVPNLHLKALLAHKGLRSLLVHYGSIAVPTKSKVASSLQSLNLWKVTRLDNVNWLGPLVDLRWLELGGLANVRDLPNLGKLTRLSFVHLRQLKSLSTLIPLARLPALKRFHVEGMNHIHIDDYWALAACSSLQEVTPGYSSRARNEQVNQQLGLPRVRNACGSRLPKSMKTWVAIPGALPTIHTIQPLL